MNNEYVLTGYTLMNKYMTEQRIKTRERNFRRRLDRFYEKHKDDKVLSLESEKEFLQLEQYFFNNVLIAESNQEKALVNFLNVIANVDYSKKGEE